MNRRQREKVAAVLDRLLESVRRGELTADGPAAVAMVRRIEGALIALRDDHRRPNAP